MTVQDQKAAQDLARPALRADSVAAVVLGNALEFYDFTIYAFFAEPIGKAFFPNKDPLHSLLASLALFGLGYVMRPIGGVLIGAFADRAGRKPAMLITIALMALGMLMLAVTPSYAAIGVWAQVIVIAGRLIQGLALGGEVGPVDRLPAGSGAAGASRLRRELADRQPGLRGAVRRHPRQNPRHLHRRDGDGGVGLARDGARRPHRRAGGLDHPQQAARDGRRGEGPRRRALDPRRAAQPAR